ncbi:hypothetical protein COJ68_15920 [Bacillus cereus]|uniref:phytanoyl-CoA dioxygenase family protein n=8 Tax=Bacillus cereus TaxID=1396 RepID=UPI000BF8C439|nr:phytanoyl-CoA dioxygenase family protein [Bacillus cereus]PFN97372.1 hypothetical protein COJ68_15920 [Bacillus cereus]
MTDYKKNIEEFKKNGYLLIKNVFSAEEIKELKREISACAGKDLNHEGIGAAAIIDRPIDLEDFPVGVAQGLHKIEAGAPIGVAQGLHKIEAGAPVGVAQGLHKIEAGAPVGVAQGLHTFEEVSSVVAQEVKENEMERRNEGLNELWEVNPNMRKFILNSELIKYVQGCMGVKDISLLSDTLLNKPANHGAASPLHRDAPFWKGLYPQNQINCWIPLQDTTVNNGTLGYIPGSHLDTEKLSEKPDVLMEHDLTLTSNQKEQIQFIEVEAGDVLIHHSLTLHGTGPNLTDSTRLAYVLHYMPTDSYVEGNEMFKDISGCPQLVKNGQPVSEF